jgi:hypothetical protein
MLSTIEALHKFQRRGSVIQKDLNRCHTERCAWAGPPLGVSSKPDFIQCRLLTSEQDTLCRNRTTVCQ